MLKRVLIIGLGDLGRRIAHGLATEQSKTEIILAGRSFQKNVFLTNLLKICGKNFVRFVPLDASDQKAVENVIRKESPQLIVHCAALLSPWYVSGKKSSPASKILRKAGFAAQLSAHLPLILTVMKAVREIDFQFPIVNCSYPDVINPILACLDLAPTVGSGNAGMIAAKVQAILRESSILESENTRYDYKTCVRVIAHHAHVTNAMLSRPPKNADSQARIYIGNDGIRNDQLAYSGLKVESNIELNSISAACALPIIHSLLPDGKLLRTSVPSPFGLPGGYPVSIKSGKISLDLPENVDLNETIKFQRLSAEADGIKTITENGTTIFTEKLKKYLVEIDKKLIEPLPPADAVKRFQILKKYI